VKKRKNRESEDAGSLKGFQAAFWQLNRRQAALKRINETGQFVETVPPFFGCLPVVAAFAFFVTFHLVAEQIGAHQRFERVVADFAFIVLVFHVFPLFYCLFGQTEADCSGGGGVWQERIGANAFQAALPGKTAKAA